ncbi:MAG: hypothetical protein AB7S62_14575 [Azoarcus sp.]
MARPRRSVMCARLGDNRSRCMFDRAGTPVAVLSHASPLPER